MNFSVGTSLFNTFRDYRLHLGLFIAFPYLLWGFAIHWAFLSFNSSYLFSFEHYNTLSRLFYGLIIALLIGPYFILLNDYFDAPFDILDTKKYQQNPFSKKNYNKKMFFTFSSLLAIIITIFGFLTGSIIGLLTIFVLILGTSYSAPPLRLKTVPIADFLVHGFCLGAYFFILGLYSLYLTNIEVFFDPLVILLLFYCLIDGAWIHLVSAIKDFNLDRKTNQKTSAVVFGQKNALILLNIMTFILIIGLSGFFLLSTDLTTKFGFEIIIMVIIITLIIPIVFTAKIFAIKDKIEAQILLNVRFRNVIVYPFALISVWLSNYSLFS